MNTENKAPKPSKHLAGDIPITPSKKPLAKILASTPANIEIEDVGSSLEDLSDFLTAMTEEEKKAIEAMMRHSD